MLIRAGMQLGLRYILLIRCWHQILNEKCTIHIRYTTYIIYVHIMYVIEEESIVEFTSVTQKSAGKKHLS